MATAIDASLPTALSQRNVAAWRRGLAEGWTTAMPACVSVVPIGFALGVLVVHLGLAWWWAPILAAVVFAGSLEFLLVGMLAAGAALPQIAITALLVNFRHVFYALSFPLSRVKGRAWKVYSTFALTDEAYALTAPAHPERWSTGRIVSIQALFHLAWVASVCLGACLATFLPSQIPGLDFAVTALFVVLSIDAYRAHRSLPLPLVALTCAAIAHVVAPGAMLVLGMGLFTAVLLAAYVHRGRRHA